MSSILALHWHRSWWNIVIIWISRCSKLLLLVSIARWLMSIMVWWMWRGRRIVSMLYHIELWVTNHWQVISYIIPFLGVILIVISNRLLRVNRESLVSFLPLRAIYSELCLAWPIENYLIFWILMRICHIHEDYIIHFLGYNNDYKLLINILFTTSRYQTSNLRLFNSLIMGYLSGLLDQVLQWKSFLACHLSEW